MSPLSPKASSASPFLTYICILSQHNVSEYQALKTLKPQRVVLISSSFCQEKGASQRFESALREIEGWAPEILILGEGTFPGEDTSLAGDLLHENIPWVAKVFAPTVETWRREGEVILNFTGGTKAMTTPLTHAPLMLNQQHYKPLGKNELHVLDDAWSSVAPIPLDEITPLEQVSLYTESVKKLSDRLGGETAEGFSLATRFWESYKLAKGEGPYWPWAEILGGLWAPQWMDAEAQALQQKRALIGPVEGRYWHASVAGCAAGGLDVDWLLSICTSETRLSIEGEGAHAYVKIPKSKHLFIQWFKGSWYESFVHKLVQQAGYDNTLANLEIKLGKDDPGNECDLLIQTGGRLKILEVKVGDQSGLLGTDATNKLNALSDVKRVGMASSAFMLSPHYTRGLQKAEQFIRRCESSDVQVLYDEEDLKSWLKKRG